MRISEYFYRRRSGSQQACFYKASGAYIRVDNLLVPIVIHLRHDSILEPRDLISIKRTSSDNLELPQPSINILAFLPGTNSRMIGAMSEYVLNQSNESSSDSLNSRRN